MSLEAFLDWEPDTHDGWKYEWHEGCIQTFERTMKPTEKAILDRLIRAFLATPAFHAGGNLFTETDFVLPGRYRVRRPDLSCYTREQIEASATEAVQVPSFIIEILSPHDNGLEMERKLDDYFASGVQCVWLVMPGFNAIRVLPTRDHSDTYRSGSCCSADPALREFMVSVDSIFGLTPAV